MEGPSTNRRLPALLIALAAVVIVSVITLALARHGLESLVLHIARSRTGRAVQIRGHFEARLLSTAPHLEATQVTIGNPTWMRPGATAEVGRLRLELHWRAAWPPFEIRRLELHGAALHLVRDSDGRANWYARPDGPGGGLPLMQSLAMPNAQVELHDARLHLEFHGRVSAGDESNGSQPPPVRIDATGLLNGRAVSLHVEGEPLASAQRSHPYHFGLEERSSGSRLIASGQLVQPFDFRALQGGFEASGDDMSDLYYLIGLQFPDTGRYRFSGRLTRRGARFVYEDLQATWGESDLHGSLTVDSGARRSRLSGELRSRLLRLADLGAKAAGRAPAESPDRPLLLSEQQFRVSALQSTDSHLAFHADTVALGAVALQQLSFELTIGQTMLWIDRLHAEVADGKLEGAARFETGQEPARGTLELRASDVQVEHILATEPAREPVEGLLSVHARLRGEGQSAHELLASANGTLNAAMPRGSMRALLAKAATLDVGGTIAALFHRDAQVQIHCALAEFDAKDGVFALRTALLDTDQALIGASGDLNMRSEALDFTVRGHPTHAGLILRGALAVRGTLRDPQVAFVPEGALPRLADIDPRLSRDSGCAGLNSRW
jgi:AsmA family protein